MKWLLDFFLPRLLLGMLIFCLMIVTGLIQPSSAAQTLHASTFCSSDVAI